MTSSAPPKVYHYDPETLVYTGTSENATQSPLDVLGVWIFPAHSTTVAPPTIPAGQEAIFSNGAWSLQNIPVPPVEPALPTTPPTTQASS